MSGWVGEASDSKRLWEEDRPEPRTTWPAAGAACVAGGAPPMELGGKS